ncbi:nucleotide-binding protein [Caballeronia grimmiae]|uniref:nucleotide-binding protein n=1 Tax=Caballeronia grimmiae TaxID=1071679 RepID=UPI0038BA7406
MSAVAKEVSNEVSNAIHIVLQGKGGVGKSLIAAFLAQYLKAKRPNVFCGDTDPVNDTFARYGAFDAKRFNILVGDKIDQRAFDGLIETLVEHQGPAVVDNGASTFIPLSAYMAENSVIDVLRESGKEVYIHSVLTGGQALEDTMTGLNALFETTPAQLVVWENEFFGEVAKDGRRFADSKLYEKNRDRVKGIVTIHKRNNDTFGKDIEQMIVNKLTFDQAMQAATLMPRQRLKIVQKSIFDQLESIGI